MTLISTEADMHPHQHRDRTQGREGNRGGCAGGGPGRAPATVMGMGTGSGRRGRGWFAWVAVSLAAGFVAGVGLGRLQTEESSVGAIGRVVPREYLASTASFSEVEMAKGEVRALGLQYLSEVEARLGPLHRVGDGDPAMTDRVVEALREGMEAFGGTAQETTLRQHLLAVLRRGGRDAEWLETYLEMAYRCPTDSLVGHQAAYAMRVARRLGRDLELMDVLRRIEGIPLVFEAKALIRAQLSAELAGLKVGGAEWVAPVTPGVIPAMAPARRSDG